MLAIFFIYIVEKCIPRSIVAALTHDIFINGCQINFSIEGSHEVEVATLYQDESFKTLDECFTEFLNKLGNKTVEQILKDNPMLEPLAITAFCA